MLLRPFILAFITFLSLQALAEPVKTIGISQFVAHPALNKVHAGILSGLEKSGFGADKLKIIDLNAAGNIATAAQIGKNLAAARVDVIVAIATPSAQAALSAAAGVGIPVVFASVTDPVGAKLVDSLEKPGKLATGTRNVTPLKEQLQLVQNLLPKAKRLGIIANHGEPNSISLLNQLKSLNAQLKQPYTLAIQSVANSAQVPSAAIELSRRADVFFLMQDNTVVLALPSIVQVARATRLPIIAGFDDALGHGALATVAPDEFQIGVATGEMVAAVLKGDNPAKIPVEDSKINATRIDKRVAKALGLVLTGRLLSFAE